MYTHTRIIDVCLCKYVHTILHFSFSLVFLKTIQHTRTFGHRAGNVGTDHLALGQLGAGVGDVQNVPPRSAAGTPPPTPSTGPYPAPAVGALGPESVGWGYTGQELA